MPPSALKLLERIERKDDMPLMTIQLKPPPHWGACALSHYEMSYKSDGADWAVSKLTSDANAFNLDYFRAEGMFPARLP